MYQIGLFSKINRITTKTLRHYDIKELPEVTVASMQTIAPSYDSFFELIPPMGDEMRRQGAACAEPADCFNIYHDGEVCEAVVEAEWLTELQIPINK